MNKCNILVIPSDNTGGVGFYRSIQPHIQLEKQFPDEFSVTFEMNPNWKDIESFKKYDIIHIHKGIFKEMGAFYAALRFFKENNIKTILDIDDHWKLGPHHPMHHNYNIYGLDKIITKNIGLFDCITTTTELFAKEIRKYNKNVFVLPNAIDPTDKRFEINKKPSDKIRIGMIMGSSHEYDMAIMDGFVNKLPKDVLDKVQFVLCGFDIRGKFKTIDKRTGRVTERKILPTETVWYRYEKMITDNYKIVDDKYKEFLNMFIPDSQYPNVESEHYKRCWTKDINSYYSHYNECDVLLAPLEVNDFNKVKSQLKAIECCFSKTAIIASDFGPYTIDLVNAIEKGGGINKNGNAILIDESKNHKNWTKFITKIVKEPELLKLLQENIYSSLHEKYDLRNVTKERSKLYKEIIKKCEFVLH